MIADHVLNRYWAKVVVAGEDECWNWSGSGSSSGYGSFSVDSTKPSISPHRLAWAIANAGGDIPDASVGWVLHTCDNRLCVNPKHLYLGTAKQNYQDMVDRDRVVHHRPSELPTCKRGHPRTPENTTRDNHGYKICRICKNANRFKKVQ